MTAAPTTQSIWSDLSEDLRRFIRRRVPDEHVAEDLLQETFVRIHRHLGSVKQTERLTAWVYRIARNVIYDQFRKGNGDAAELGDADPAAAPTNRRLTASDQAQVWMEELIQQVPEPYREAIRLSEIEGLSQQEVADRLGLSLSGAKSRIQRGRAKLRETLERCCTFEFDRRGNLQGCDPLPTRTVCRSCDELDASGDCG